MQITVVLGGHTIETGEYLSTGEPIYQHVGGVPVLIDEDSLDLEKRVIRSEDDHQIQTIVEYWHGKELCKRSSSVILKKVPTLIIRETSL